ncbi:hypothetical protein DYB32_003535 [Aphanomyces invadans]|uniref:Cyclic nucleotide-binding domain-containing protein n=1 Tax=Aphanomyces invadans TaxID=157072 RepID=A0A3R7D5N5_9STRA|nr:hypothetical protein DYB32_003535 [Aphanomyces invadans]
MPEADGEAPVVSAYMTRQAERAEITGLSPMEEMRLAHGELAAKAAKKRNLDDLPVATSFHLNHFLQVPPVKKVLKRMQTSVTGMSGSNISRRRDGFRNAPSVVCEAEVKRITQELANNIDDMTAEQAMNFVQSVQQRENIIKMRVDDYDAKRVPWYLISPASKFRVRWDILSVVLIICTFFIDVLSAMPAEAIYLACLPYTSEPDARLNKYFKFLRIIKLTRMLGFTHILNRCDGINNFMEVAATDPNRFLPRSGIVMHLIVAARFAHGIAESKILSELSALLRSKIALAINDSVLNKMPFFEGADHNFLMELALSMKMVCFPPHEEVIVEGEIGQEMFFIFRGAVEVMKDGEQIAVLGEQQYFGEMAIMNTNCTRLATIRTLCFCELRMLTRQKFLVALSHFPSMRKRIARIIHRRQTTHDQEMVRRKSADLTGPQMPTSTSSLKKLPRGGLIRQGSANPTVMENLAASMVQSSRSLLEKKGPDIFTLEPDNIVGSTMQRISQMNVVPNGRSDDVLADDAPADSDMRQIIQALLDQQEALLAEVAKLEDKVRALTRSTPDSDLI